ncbi:MAG TPA: hypothetical protein VE132_00750 [Micromonosporaceae bacterium]|nr:hypothetical protein [Micromonosporaceae bacterium]
MKVPAWQYLFAALLVAASIGYSVACFVALAAVGSLRSLSVHVLAGQHVDLITVQKRLHAVSHTANVVNGLWPLLFVLFVAWLVLANRRYAAAGQPLRISRAARYALFSGGVVSIILTAYALRFTGMRTVADVHRMATIDMTFLAVRAAVGIIYAWCTAALLAARRRREPPAPATVAGADLSYEEYMAMRAAQRLASPAAPTTPAVIPPIASAGEMTSEAPSV